MNTIPQPASQKGLNITNSYAFLFKRSILLGITVLGLLVFMASMWHRFIYIDDAFFGEQAYWLAKDGVVKTVTLIDFLGCDHQLFSYHKLNIFVGAALIRLFGWSVTPLRMSTLIFLVGFLLVYFRYFRENKLKFGLGHFVMAIFIMLFNPLIVLYAFTYRPEIWVMFFGFTSYFFLDKSARNNYRINYIVLAGIMAGLAFLSHLNGLIFPVAGFVVLALAKQWKGLLAFSLSAGVICMLYFFDLWQDNHFATWMYQLRNWPDNNATNYLSHNFMDLILNIIRKLADEHQRFFWSDRVWVISAFFLLAFLANVKYLFREHFVLAVYTLILIFTLNVAGGQIAERFLIYFFPFMALIIALDVEAVKGKTALFRKSVYIILVMAQIAFVTKMFVGIFRRNADHIEINKNILARIPEKNVLILVPYTLVFNGLDEYKLASFKAFEYYQKSLKHNLTQQELFLRAIALNIKYIVVPLKGAEDMETGLPCLEDHDVGVNAYYKEFWRDKRCVLLERIE